MSRFVLSHHAKVDLEHIRAYLRTLPKEPALRIGRALQKSFKSIADNPFLGATQSELTRLAGVEVRSRLVRSYRVFYTSSASIPEIIAILHTARDIAAVVAERLQ